MSSTERGYTFSEGMRKKRQFYRLILRIGKHSVTSFEHTHRRPLQKAMQAWLDGKGIETVKAIFEAAKGENA